MHKRVAYQEPVVVTYASEPVDSLAQAELTEFDELTTAAAALADADSNLLAAKSQLAECEKNISELIGAREMYERKQHKLQKRLDKNETNPVLKHTLLRPDTWFSGGVRGKVQRIRLERSRSSSDLDDTCNKLEGWQKLESPLRAAVPQLERDAARKFEVSCAAVTLFESLVHLHQTGDMQSLEDRAFRRAAAVQLERANSAAVERMLRQIQEARGAYAAAMRALQRTTASNDGAQPDIAEPAVLASETVETGCELSEGKRHRTQLVQLLQEAAQLAEIGGRRMADAFSYIPDACRRRHPRLTAKLGAVRVPSLEQMGLGGFVNAAADVVVGAEAAAKVRRIIQMLGECERAVAGEEATCQSLVASVQSDGNDAAKRLRDANANLFDAKVRIFNQLRRGCQMPPAPPLAFAAAFDGGKVTYIEPDGSEEEVLISKSRSFSL